MYRQINLSLIVIYLLLISIGCDTVENTNETVSAGGWLIPENEVFDGGPGKDGIPALTSPSFTNINSISYLDEEDLVLIVSMGNEIRIYPHPILDWHEIINDKIGNTAFAITYCPLTGSGICWNSVLDGEETTFGVSGLLYNTNLIPYDRKTGSNWSQMRLQSVNGSLISTFVETFPLVETSWETAKSLFPNANVVSKNTGFSRSYGSYPYGSYRTNHSSLIFPVNHNDDRLNSKERVLGVFGANSTKAYRLLDFDSGRFIIDNFDNENFLIYGDSKNNILIVFNITSRFADLEFFKSSESLPYIVKDNLGNHYDIFGKSKDPNKEDLIPAKSFIAYWFAWAAFYPDTELYQ